MSRRQTDIWSHPSHYLVDPYTWPSDHFWLRYSKFHIWPWKFKVKVIAKVKPDGHIWGLEFNRYVCFSFHGNRTILDWDITNSIFDLENSRSMSCQDQTWLSHLRPKFQVWPWKFKVKVMPKVKPDCHIWGPEFYHGKCQTSKQHAKIGWTWPF